MPNSSTESISTRMNGYFANQNKNRGSHPYFKEARLQNNIGRIFMTMAGHSDDEIDHLLAGCHSALTRDLDLPDFVFEKDIKKIKVLVAGIPHADTGFSSLGKVDDWVGEKVFDELRVDIEESNPGVVMSGKPSIFSSIHAMKSSKVTKCLVLFMMKNNKAVDEALAVGKLCLRGSNRAFRI